MAVSFDDLPPQDAALLGRLIPLNDAMRGAACGLARLGVRFRREDAQRAARWIALLEPHPFYKLGQVMFDLLEWEDFMLDGEPPETVPADLIAAANRLLAAAEIEVPADARLPDDLPALESGFYLYRDVVLGLIWMAVRSEAESAAPTRSA